MGRDLVDHHVRPGQISDEVAPRAGHAHGLHVRKLPVPLKDIPEPRPHRLDGTAGGHEVVLRHDLTVFIHEHYIGGDGTDVDAEEHPGTALQRQAQAAPDRVAVVRRERGSRRLAGCGGRRTALRDARLGTPRQTARSRSVRQGGGGRTERRHEPCGNLRPGIRGSPASRRRHADGLQRNQRFHGHPLPEPFPERGQPLVGYGFPLPSKQEQRRAERAGKREILGHEQPILLKVQDGTQGLDYARVGGNPADQRHGQFQRLHTHHVGLEAAGQRVAQPGYDVLHRGALLLEVDHVRLGKDRAAPGNTGGSPRPERGLPEFGFDVEAEAGSLLIEEAARAGRAHGADRKVLEPQAVPLPGGLKLDILAVLPADVDDGTRLRAAERSRRHLRDDLVYSARAEQTAHTIRARARDRRGDACVRPLQRLKLGAQHLIRLSVMTDIPAVQGRPQPVEKDHIDTY